MKGMSLTEDLSRNEYVFHIDITPYVHEQLARIQVEVEGAIEAEVVRLLREKGYQIVTPNEQETIRFQKLFDDAKFKADFMRRHPDA